MSYVAASDIAPELTESKYVEIVIIPWWFEHTRATYDATNRNFTSCRSSAPNTQDHHGDADASEPCPGSEIEAYYAGANIQV